jgi:urea transport system permease protein
MLFMATAVHALTADEAKAIASGESESRITALNKAVLTADEKTTAFIQAMSEDAVKYTEDKVFVMKDDKGYDPVTGAELKVPDTAEDVVNNNLMRGALDAAQAALKLTSKDDAVRAEAAQALFKEPDESRVPMVEKALAAETNPAIKAQLQLVRAASMLAAPTRPSALSRPRSLAPTAALTPSCCSTSGSPTRPKRTSRPPSSLPLPASTARWCGATASTPCSAASAWARCCCWPRWAWPLPTA